MRNKCNHCGYLIVRGIGPVNSRILLLGSSPDYEDMSTGVCLSGNLKNIIQLELSRVGLALTSLRYTNIWQHSKNDECKLDWHINQGTSEIKGKTHVLLMGSDASRALFGRNAGDISGLVMHSKSFPKVTFVTAPSPTELFNSTVGEFRLALSRFSGTIKK